MATGWQTIVIEKGSDASLEERLSLVRACATRSGFGGVALVLLLGTSAFGSEAWVNGESEFLLLVQIGILIFVGRGLGELMQRVGQPSVMGQLVAGLLLGPSVLGSLWPAAQHALSPLATNKGQ